MPILGIKSIENSHILEDFLLISCCSFVLKSSLVYSEKQKTWANLNFKETEIYLGYFWEAAWKGIDVERRCFHTLVSKPGNLCSNSWKSFALRSLPTEWFTVGLPSPYLSPQLSLASGQTTRIKLVILCERMLEKFPLAARVVCLEMFVVTLCEAINGSGFLEIQRRKRQNCFLCCCFLFLPTTAFYWVTVRRPPGRGREKGWDGDLLWIDASRLNLTQRSGRESWWWSQSTHPSRNFSRRWEGERKSKKIFVPLFSPFPVYR